MPMIQLNLNTQVKPSIIYFGNPEFAVEGLRVLHESGYEILGVVTGEDNHGRPSDVKKCCKRECRS